MLERSALMNGLRSCFARTQTWLQAGKYITALASGLAAVNGWTIAEECGDRSPDATQRLLNRASWDELAVMSEVRTRAAAGLDREAERSRRRRMAVGALDETGHGKQGPTVVILSSRVSQGRDLRRLVMDSDADGTLEALSRLFHLSGSLPDRIPADRCSPSARAS